MQKIAVNDRNFNEHILEKQEHCTVAMLKGLRKVLPLTKSKIDW